MQLIFSKFFQRNFPHKSVFSLSNAIVGASVLSMAYCFQQCGIILATMLMIFCGLITSYSCKLLIASAQSTHTTNYEYLAFRAMGRPMKLIVELSSIGLLCGSIIAYQMIVGDLGSVVVSQIFNITNTPLIRAFVILILTCTISFPLSLSERFDHLTPISIQSIIFYLIFCIYTFAQFWSNPISTSFDMDKLVYWKWSGLFVSLPIVSLSFSCQTMLFVVYSELSDSTSHAMNTIIDISVTLVGFIYFISGLFGYLVFYSTYDFIPGNVMQIFPKNLFQQIFLWGFILNCTTGIPFMVNPTRGSLFTLWDDRRQESLFGECHIIPRRLFFIFTAIIVFIPTLIAIFIPNLEFALALTGATSGQLICYILPAIIAIHIIPNGINLRKTQALLIFGIIALIICTIKTFQKELEDKTEPIFISTSASVLTTSLSYISETMNISSVNVAEQ